MFHKVDDSFLGLITPYFKLSAFLSQSKKLFAITCHIIVNMDHFTAECGCNFEVIICSKDRFIVNSGASLDSSLCIKYKEKSLLS